MATYICSKCSEVIAKDDSQLYDRAEKMFALLRKEQTLKHEKFWAMYFLSYRAVSDPIVIGIGNNKSVVPDPRLIIEHGIKLNADGVVVAHNHPGGAASPSPPDKRFTKWLQRGLVVARINLIDHIVFTNDCYFSMSRNKMITRQQC